MFKTVTLTVKEDDGSSSTYTVQVSEHDVSCLLEFMSNNAVNTEDLNERE